MFYALVLSAAVAQASPACSEHDGGATITRIADAGYLEGSRQASRPNLFADDPVPMHSIVAVDVDSRGHVAGVNILRSSGHATFDESARLTAEDSTYVPARRNCSDVAGKYFLMYEANLPGGREARFRSPSGWLRDSSPYGNAQYWAKGKNHITLSYFATTVTLDDFIAFSNSDARGMVAASKVQTCGGTQEGYRMLGKMVVDVDRPWLMGETITVIKDRIEYTASYFSETDEMPDSVVDEALLSLCAP